MIRMMADASIENLTRVFDDEFEITTFINERDLREKIAGHSLLLCRSTLKVESDLLTEHQIECVVTVSSGTDHITQGYPIKIIDAKGANARSVADYVITCVAYCQLRAYLSGWQVGIIGAGAVGSAVALRLESLGFNVKLYDPLRAERDPDFLTCELESLLDCDLLCVHANLQDNTSYPSRQMLNARFLSQVKSGTVIINAARGDIVDEKALMNCQQTLYYCTDVYANEPQVNAALIDYATLCTPHIAGHSIEAKTNALYLVSQKIRQWYGHKMSVVQNEKAMVDLPNTAFSSWQQAILSIYNPELETLALKQAHSLAQKFLELRKAHCFRHDFDCYAGSNSDSILETALGRE
ncbi:MAG: NAD(P)-dependent oxidoreductase [Gammaproteobacteria bacterium]